MENTLLKNSHHQCYRSIRLHNIPRSVIGNLFTYASHILLSVFHYDRIQN